MSEQTVEPEVEAPAPEAPAAEPPAVDEAELVRIVHSEIEGVWGPVPRSALEHLPEWTVYEE